LHHWREGLGVLHSDHDVRQPDCRATLFDLLGHRRRRPNQHIRCPRGDRRLEVEAESPDNRGSRLKAAGSFSGATKAMLASSMRPKHSPAAALSHST
jgi:hypothetical protein